jgi:hypothetical protein
MSQTWVCHSAESGRFCASGDRPDRAPAGCSYGYLSGRVPRMLLGCLGCGKRPKVSSQATCLDFVEVAIHPYRHRYRAAESDPAFEPIEAELAKQRRGLSASVRHDDRAQPPSRATSRSKRNVDVLSRFARDSPLEGSGFEISVPPQGPPSFPAPNSPMELWYRVLTLPRSGASCCSTVVGAGRDDLEHQLEIVQHRKKGC